MPTNIALGKAYSKSVEPSGTYPDTGNAELTDGNRGLSSDFADASWQGHQNLAAALLVTIDFGIAQPALDEFRLYTFEDTPNGIYRPQTVEVFTSNNDAVYTSRGSVDALAAVNDAGGRWVYTIVPAASVSARYVRYDITRQVGREWVFVAEVEIDGVALAAPPEQPRSLAEAFLTVVVSPEASPMLGDALLLGIDVQDSLAPSGRVQHVRRGTGRVTHEEP